MTPLALAGPSGARKSNLAFALFTLPRDRRRDALTFYDFCRVVDDIADDPDLPAEEKRAWLERWSTALREETGLPPSLSDLITRRKLDPALLQEIVRGVSSDIDPPSYATFTDLQAYCWKVACAVGLVSLEIFGCQNPASRVYAEKLGYALQLTNILRDVGEDAGLGRVYLPREELARFQVSPQSLLAGQPDGDFLGLLTFQANRAAAFFAEARSSLPPEDAAALLPAEVMRAIYEKILCQMQKDNFRVFSRRYRVPLPAKLWLAAGKVLGFR